MTIHMLPLSFLEYTKVFPKKEKYVAYNDYINNSSFPFMINLEADQVSNYMENIYDTIVLKDIMFRKNCSDSMRLNSVLKFIMDNIGNPLSVRKLNDTMLQMEEI